MLESRLRRALRHLDPTYLRNRALYFLAQNPPIDDSAGGDDASSAAQRLSDERPPAQRWDVSSAPLRETVHVGGDGGSAVPGLFIHRGYFDADQLADINRFTARVAAEHPHGWFTYHQGRRMMPLQVADTESNPLYKVSDSDNVMTPRLRTLLHSLQSTNGTDPHSWPSVSRYCQVPNYDPGAKLLRKLQIDLSSGMLLPSAKGQPCLFYQVQNVERGGAVGSHIDPLEKGGRCIATLTTTGTGTDIRVGDTVLFVEPGDVYGIEEYARYGVEHEVLPSVDDRMTYTMRFGWHCPELAEQWQ
eukprot:g3760.t1